MLVREFVSAIRHNLQSLTLDSYISSEYIYNIGINISKLLTKRESDSRRLFKNTSDFTYIACVELEEVPLIQCTNVSIPKCKKVMRSKKPLPEVFSSIYGSVMLVFSLNRDKDYIEINPISYKSVLNQEYKPKSKAYFWMENKYLVIPDSEVEVVSVLLLTSEVDTTLTGTASNCGKILDTKFPGLDYLMGSVIELTTKQVSTMKQIPIDEMSNLNNNQK